jgi:hypothetical protein
MGNFSPPSFLFQECFKAENGIFVMVVPIDAVGVFDQLSIVDVPPPIAITDTGNVPGGVIDGTGDEMTNIHGL